MSKKQNQYLFVVIDMFTIFVWIKPLRTANTDHNIKFIEEEIFLKYGVYQSFICDKVHNLSRKISRNLWNHMESKFVILHNIIRNQIHVK